MSAVILILSVVSLIFAEERLVLTGSDHAVTAHVGEEVILNCFVDSHILPDEVSWMKLDSDKSNILVLLFQNNETYPDSADASYQGRTEFFNAEIPKGNFSLRLKDVRTEDKGVYMCEAHSGHLSANTTVTLQGLGLSTMHMLVLALCCSAVIVALVVSALILLDIKERRNMKIGKVVYEYSAMEHGELDLVIGKTIEILQKNDSAWCLGKYNDKVGLFQSNYVQVISPPQDTGKVRKSKVLFEFFAEADDELDLVVGETIEILDENDSEWWQGKHNGKVGFFPFDCVQTISPLQGKVANGNVVNEYSAMKSDELDLVVGETIEIFQMYDGWSLGKHKDKVGLFPLHCIEEMSALQDVSQRALRMHYVLVFVPSILMFIAFVLWGVIEGFLGEVVTCSTLNLIRFILLFKTSLYKEKLPEMIKTIIQKAFIFEYFIVVSVLYFVIFFNVWNTEGESKAMSFMGIMYGSSLHMGIQAFFAGGGFVMEFMDFFYLFLVSYTSRTFNNSAFISMFVGVAIAILSIWIVEGVIKKRYSFMFKSDLYWLGNLAYYLVRRLIISTVVFYFFYQILENNDERAGLLCITALLHLLNLAYLFDFCYKSTLSETPKMVLYLYGAIGTHAINGTTLTTELILKSRKGERTIADLRVVVVPLECVFILGWIFLWAHAYWAENKTGVNKELNIYKQNGCRLWIKSLKEDAKPEDGCEMAEITHQSSSTSLQNEQGSSQESPSNADINIHAPGDVPEETDVVLSESDEIIHEEYPPSTETVGESVAPLHPDADMNGSTAKDISTPSLSEDNDAVSKTLLSHGEREPETNLKESRHDSVTEHMESSPLLQEDMAKSIPHSESN